MSEEKRARGRPATGITPKRNIRVGAIWDEAEKVAKRRQETMTVFVIRAIEREVQRIREEEGETEPEG